MFTYYDCHCGKMLLCHTRMCSFGRCFSKIMIVTVFIQANTLEVAVAIIHTFLILGA